MLFPYASPECVLLFWPLCQRLFCSWNVLLMAYELISSQTEFDFYTRWSWKQQAYSFILFIFWHFLAKCTPISQDTTWPGAFYLQCHSCPITTKRWSRFWYFFRLLIWTLREEQADLLIGIALFLTWRSCICVNMHLLGTLIQLETPNKTDRPLKRQKEQHFKEMVWSRIRCTQFVTVSNAFDQSKSLNIFLIF